MPVLYKNIMTRFHYRGIDDVHIEFCHLHVECDDEHTDMLLEIMTDLAEENLCQTENMIDAGNAVVDARLHFHADIARTDHPAIKENVQRF